jgi:hypothetical protein
MPGDKRTYSALESYFKALRQVDRFRQMNLRMDAMFKREQNKTAELQAFALQNLARQPKRRI